MACAARCPKSGRGSGGCRSAGAADAIFIASRERGGGPREDPHPHDLRRPGRPSIRSFFHRTDLRNEAAPGWAAKKTDPPLHSCFLNGGSKLYGCMFIMQRYCGLCFAFAAFVCGTALTRTRYTHTSNIYHSTTTTLPARRRVSCPRRLFFGNILQHSPGSSVFSFSLPVHSPLPLFFSPSLYLFFFKSRPHRSVQSSPAALRWEAGGGRWAGWGWMAAGKGWLGMAGEGEGR